MPRVASLETLVIEGIDPAGDGAGYAMLGTRPVLIDDVLPGERVEARVGEAGSGRLRGELVRVVSASPFRVNPICRHAGTCGGCAWQHIAYPEQLRIKRNLVAQWLRRRLGRGAPPVEAVLHGGAGSAASGSSHDGGGPAEDVGEHHEGSPRGFRNKVHFVFGGAAGGLVMGHYRRRSQEVVAVDECPVHDERGNQVAFAVRDSLRQRHIEAATPDGRRGLARHIVVRVARATGERLATLVVTRNDKALRPAVRGVLNGNSPPEGFHLNVHNHSGPLIFGETTLRIHGAARAREVVAGRSFLISPTAFFQTNISATDLLVQVVIEHAGHSPRVLDLYAGAGLFSLPLASGGARVTAVEEDPEAVQDGEASRRLNHISASACRFVCARVESLAAGRSSTRLGAEA